MAQIYSTASNYEEALAIYDHISSSLLPDANVNVEKSKRLDKTMKSDLDNLRKKLKELERLVRGNVLKTKAAFWMKKEEQMNSMTSSLSHLQLENQKQKKQSDVREVNKRPLIFLFLLSFLSMINLFFSLFFASNHSNSNYMQKKCTNMYSSVIVPADKSFRHHS